MAELTWRTGQPADQAKQLIETQLQKTGYGDQVTWDGNRFSASAGMGYMLDISGVVNDQQIVLEKCGGMTGGMVLGKLKKMLEFLFPGGEAT